MENKGIVIEQFLRDFTPLVKKVAWEIMSHYSGWFNNPKEELKDFISLGMMELVSIYPGIDFENPGYANFISIRIKGCLLNYVNKNIPSISIKDKEVFEVTGDGWTEKRQKKFIRPVLLDDIQDTRDDFKDESEIELELFRHKILSMITEFMETLSPVERFIFIARFVDEKSLKEIGLSVNLLRDAVSRRIESILNKLKKFLKEKYSSWRLDSEHITSYLQERGLEWVIRVEEE